jgi:hypothetical protein
MPGEEHSFFTERRRADALVALAATRLAEDQEPDRATLIVHARVDGDGRPTGGFEVEGGPAIPNRPPVDSSAPPASRPSSRTRPATSSGWAG